MKEIIRYSFPDETVRELVEEDVALAVYVTECIHGSPQARLDVSYFVNSSGRRCVMAVRGPAGETAARVFTGLCSARFGEDGFQVERDAIGVHA